MKAYFFPRALAYIVDIIIISLIALSIFLLFPQYKNTKKLTNEMSSTYDEYLDKEITTKQFIARVNDITYDLSYAEVPYTIVSITLTILYFVVFQNKNNGQTLGKKIFKIKVISENGEQLNTNNYLFRSLICHSVLLNFIEIAIIMFINKNIYGYIGTILSFLQFMLLIICIIMVLYKKDGRGLHDLLGNTKVVMADREVK